VAPAPQRPQRPQTPSGQLCGTPVERRGASARANDAVERVHHHALFQEDVAPVESYGVRPAAVLTVVAIVVAAGTLATGAGAGTSLWFVRPSAVLAVLIGLVGTPSLARRRSIVRARARR
jgi:hypothetical protein